MHRKIFCNSSPTKDSATRTPLCRKAIVASMAVGLVHYCLTHLQKAKTVVSREEGTKKREFDEAGSFAGKLNTGLEINEVDSFIL